MFANLSASLNALGSQVQYGLQQFVNEAVNQPASLPLGQGGTSGSYADPSDSIPFLLRNGTYASPLPDIPESVAAPDGTLAAALSAPIINAHWQLSRTVVVMASNKTSGDLCVGENGVPGYAKYCDDNKNMWAIVSLPTDNSQIKFIPTLGLDKLERFGLDVQAVTQASYNHYRVNGFNSKTTSRETISAVAALDPRDIKRSDVIFFNLPVCFLDLVPQLSYSQELSCSVSLLARLMNMANDTQFFTTKEENTACRLYMQVTCGCPVTPGWLYGGDEVNTFCGPPGPRPGVGVY